MGMDRRKDYMAKARELKLVETLKQISALQGFTHQEKDLLWFIKCETKIMIRPAFE